MGGWGTEGCSWFCLAWEEMMIDDDDESIPTPHTHTPYLTPPNKTKTL